MKKILTVDWDYFFPNGEEFDWGANEEQALFFEFIWSVRGMNRNDKKQRAVDVMYSEGWGGFWERMVSGYPSEVRISESHKDVYAWMRGCGETFEVTNFDAHSDMRPDGFQDVDCGNWAFRGLAEKLISKYTLVYPKWRQKCMMPMDDSFGKKVRVLFKPPKAQEYDLVHVCRSSCWTPSWSDGDWLRFIEYWQLREIGGRFRLWVESRVKEARMLDLRSAMKMADEMDAQVAKLLKR